MKTTQQPSRRRLLSWAIALLAVGAAGIIPWQLVPREAIAQDRPAVPSAVERARDGKNEPALAARGTADLKEAEARLRIALAEQKVARAQNELARKVLARYGAEAERWRVQVERLRREVEPGRDRAEILAESLNRLQATEADRDVGRAELLVSRATLDAANAGVREAEALRDIARIESGNVRAQADLKTARTRLREARLDGARAERDAARAGVERAEADLKKSEADVQRWEVEVKRLEREIARSMIDSSVLLESMNELKSRKAERDADAARLELARARLEAAEARLHAAESEAEAGAARRRPQNPANRATAMIRSAGRPGTAVSGKPGSLRRPHVPDHDRRIPQARDDPLAVGREAQGLDPGARRLDRLDLLLVPQPEDADDPARRVIDQVPTAMACPSGENARAFHEGLGDLDLAAHVSGLAVEPDDRAGAGRGAVANGPPGYVLPGPCLDDRQALAVGCEFARRLRRRDALKRTVAAGDVHDLGPAPADQGDRPAIAREDRPGDGVHAPQHSIPG